jgi:fructose-1,6-bisphosphatase/inositol monophosphatase family enzyme
MGSNALSLASVGAGRVSGTLIGRFGPIDCHAGALIAKESGATVVAVGEGVLCAAPGVADELVELWRKATDGA